MNLECVLQICGYGTSEGVKKSWDTRGRGKKTSELIERAVKEFGLTDNPREAGYVLQDGRMLDFSGKRDGGDPNIRSYDHREISRAYPDDADTSNFRDFMNDTGALRFGMYGDDLDVEVSYKNSELSSSQIKALEDAASYAKVSANLFLDICDERGNTLVTTSTGNVNAASIEGLYRKARRAAWTEVHRDRSVK